MDPGLRRDERNRELRKTARSLAPLTEFYANLLTDLLKANANWAHAVECDEDDSGFEVKWDAKRKQPRWDLIALHE